MNNLYIILIALLVCDYACVLIARLLDSFKEPDELKFFKTDREFYIELIPFRIVYVILKKLLA